MGDLDKDILDDFLVESGKILKELQTVVEDIEESGEIFPSELLESFSQKIDRIMGAADTLLMMDPNMLSLKTIGRIARICKSLGYTAAKCQKKALIPIFAAFWAETLELLEQIMDAIQSPEESKKIIDSSAPQVQKRLTWLSRQVQKILGSGATPQESVNVDELMKQFGK